MAEHTVVKDTGSSAEKLQLFISHSLPWLPSSHLGVRLCSHWRQHPAPGIKVRLLGCLLCDIRGFQRDSCAVSWMLKLTLPTLSSEITIWASLISCKICLCYPVSWKSRCFLLCPQADAHFTVLRALRGSFFWVCDKTWWQLLKLRCLMYLFHLTWLLQGWSSSSLGVCRPLQEAPQCSVLIPATPAFCSLFFQ